MTSRLFISFYCLMVCLMIHTVLAQVGQSTCSGRCISRESLFNNKNITDSLSFCQRHLPNSSYICVTSDYAADDTNVKNNYSNNSKFLPDDFPCAQAWKRFACMRKFAACDPNTGITYPVCYSDCLSYTNACWNRDNGYNPFNWFYGGVFFLNTDLDKKFLYFCAKNSAGLMGQTGDSIDYSATPTTPCTTSAAGYPVASVTILSMILLAMSSLIL